MAGVIWVTILEAPRPRVEVVRGLLDAEGIATFVPDDLTKTVDPFITGGNAFTVTLQVPADDLERARAVAARHVECASATQASVPESPRTGDLAADEDDEQAAAEPDDPVEGHATRTVLCTCLLVTVPLALVFGVLYL